MIIKNTYCVSEQYMYLTYDIENENYFQRFWWNDSIFFGSNRSIEIKNIIPLKKSCYNYSEYGAREKFNVHNKHFTITTNSICDFYLTPEYCACGCDQKIKFYRKVEYCETCYHNLLNTPRGIIIKKYFIQRRFSYNYNIIDE